MWRANWVRCRWCSSMNRHEQTLGPISIFRPPNSVPQLLIKEEENNIVDWQNPALKTTQRTRNEFKINMTLSCLYTHELRYKKCFSHTKRSTIIRNGNPNLASELLSARGCHFTQPFTNNYALEHTGVCKNMNNRNPNPASRLRSARGRPFSQPIAYIFT